MKKQLKIEEKKKQTELSARYNELAKVIIELGLRDAFMKAVVHHYKSEEHLKLKHLDRLILIVKEMEKMIKKHFDEEKK